MAFLHQVLRVFAVDGDEFGNVALGTRQIFRKIQADARRRGFLIDLVVHHPETALGTQFVISFPHWLVVGNNVEAHLQCVDGRAPV